METSGAYCSLHDLLVVARTINSLVLFLCALKRSTSLSLQRMLFLRDGYFTCRKLRRDTIPQISDDSADVDGDISAIDCSKNSTRSPLLS